MSRHNPVIYIHSSCISTYSSLFSPSTNGQILKLNSGPPSSNFFFFSSPSKFSRREAKTSVCAPLIMILMWFLRNPEHFGPQVVYGLLYKAWSTDQQQQHYWNFVRNIEPQVCFIYEHQNPHVFLILMRGREAEDMGAKLLALNFLGTVLRHSFSPYAFYL